MGPNCFGTVMLTSLNPVSLSCLHIQLSHIFSHLPLPHFVPVPHQLLAIFILSPLRKLKSQRWDSVRSHSFFPSYITDLSCSKISLSCLHHWLCLQFAFFSTSLLFTIFKIGLVFYSIFFCSFCTIFLLALAIISFLQVFLSPLLLIPL